MDVSLEEGFVLDHLVEFLVFWGVEGVRKKQRI